MMLRRGDRVRLIDGSPELTVLQVDDRLGFILVGYSEGRNLRRALISIEQVYRVS